MIRYHWTFSVDDEIHDAEYDTKPEALKAAQDAFDEECANSDDYKRSQERDIKILLCHYDDEDGRVVLSFEKATVYYEYEKSDYEEHFNQRDYI